jgi:hypothetical protein
VANHINRFLGFSDDWSKGFSFSGSTSLRDLFCYIIRDRVCKVRNSCTLVLDV